MVDLLLGVGYAAGSALGAVKHYWPLFLVVIALSAWSARPAVRIFALLLPLAVHLAIVFVKDTGELPSAASVIGPLLAAALALLIALAIRWAFKSARVRAVAG